MKVLKALAENYGLEIFEDKTNVFETLKIAKGIIRGFYVVIESNLTDGYIAKINIVDNNREEILDLLKKGINSNVKELSIIKNYVKILFKDKVEENEIKNVLNKIIEILFSQKLESKCAFCGENHTNIALTTILKEDSEAFYLCESCHTRQINELEEKKLEKEAIKENVIFGFIGAVLGTIPGILLWFLLARIRVFAVISAPLIIFGAMSMYSGFGKKIGIIGQIISGIVGLGGLYVAHFLDTAFQLRKEIRAEGVKIGIIDAMKNLSNLLKVDAGVKDYFYKDRFFVIGIILIVICILLRAKSLVRESKGLYKIDRI